MLKANLKRYVKYVCVVIGEGSHCKNPERKLRYGGQNVRGDNIYSRAPYPHCKIVDFLLPACFASTDNSIICTETTGPMNAGGGGVTF